MTDLVKQNNFYVSSRERSEEKKDKSELLEAYLGIYALEEVEDIQQFVACWERRISSFPQRLVCQQTVSEEWWTVKRVMKSYYFIEQRQKLLIESERLLLLKPDAKQHS